MRSSPFAHSFAIVSGVVIALALGGAPFDTVAAHATAEQKSSNVTYEGGLRLTSTDGFTIDVSARLVVDCATEPCAAVVTITEGDFVASPTNDQSVPVVSGQANADFPYYGDICALRFIGAGSVTITFAADSATLTRNSAPVSTSCADGAEASASGAVLAGALTLVSGESCLIDDSCPTPTPTPTAEPIPTATPAPISAPAPVMDDDRTLDEPGILSTLRPMRSVLTATNLLWAASGAIVLAILIAFPTVLLDSTSERLTERIERKRAARLSSDPLSAPPPPLTLIGWPAALGGLVVAAAASTLVDPDFGVDAVGLRTALGILAGFLIVIALGWLLVSLTFRRTHPESRPRIEFRALSLVFVALAVAASLISGFQPGIVFGLIAGVGFGAVISTRARASAAALMVAFMLIMATLAWGGYSLLSDYFGATADLISLIVLEVLSAVTIAGFSALPIALVPLRGLMGAAVWAFSRLLWVLLYVIAIGGFLLVLIPLPDSWQLVELDLIAWSIGYAAYLGVAVVAWLAASQPWDRRGASESDVSA